MTTKQKSTYFYSIEEINAMLPSVEAAVYKLIQMHAQVNVIVSQLKLADVPLGEQLSVNEINHYDEHTADNISSLKVLLNAIQEEVVTIKMKGGVVSCVEKGIVNWIGKKEEKKFLFSWKLGEKSISFWQVDKKNNTRHPLSEL